MRGAQSVYFNRINIRRSTPICRKPDAVHWRTGENRRSWTLFCDLLRFAPWRQRLRARNYERINSSSSEATVQNSLPSLSKLRKSVASFRHLLFCSCWSVRGRRNSARRWRLECGRIADARFFRLIHLRDIRSTCPIGRDHRRQWRQ